MSGTKFKDGLVSGDEIKSEGDIQAISGKNIVAVSTDTAKKITMHHDEAGGHISATQQLEIDSPSTIVKAGSKNILSGNTTETKLYHSNDGTAKLTTQAQGITVYGSAGVTAKKFKFPALGAGADAAAGSTAATDFAFIQAQKIGTSGNDHSVLDFTIGDNVSTDKFRFRFDPWDTSISSGAEYSLVSIAARADGCTVMDLTDSHNLTAASAETSEVKAGFFRGKADTVAALTDLDTNDLSEGTNNLYFTQSRARGSISVATAATPSGGGALSYDDGVFTYTPPALSGFLSAIPTTSKTVMGGIKLADNTQQTTTVNSVSTTTGRTYAVQLDSSSKAVVNVPWTDDDTTYETATSTVAGLVKIGYTEDAANRKYPVELDSGQMYVNVPWVNTVTTAATRDSLGLDTDDNVYFGNITGDYITALEGLRSKGDVIAYHSSDKRLKENIVNIPNALDKVNQLNGVTYDWSEAHIKSRGGEDGYFVKKNDTGLIAQEVEQVLPEVVRSREDGYLGIQYDKIVGLLVEAIKELKAEVEELKKNK